MLKRARIDIQGRVQGVGFRPLLWRYAQERGLSGWVSNTSAGVLVELEGASENIDNFLKALKTFPPPQAEITGISISSVPLKNSQQFEILPSITQEKIKTQISPDLATCPDCLKELFAPKDRRYLYPFLNCTNCGPRFTIVRNIPYDRDKTTMEKFVMCPQCQEEYENPLNRRFHAQPDCCPQCGPQIELVNREKSTVYKGEDALKETIRLLKKGKIVAIKGLGGFHLACDATNDKAVGNLRGRKYREDKPFALMAKDLETIKRYSEVSLEEKELLLSFKRPILLLKRIENEERKEISKKVAPNNKYLGFMLPYTPLHYLLFNSPSSIPNSQLSVLVMTSGNISDEPIAYENEGAFSRVSHIADYFLVHNRDIYIRCDDSVTRVFPPTKRELAIRRSRGYVPSPLKVPFTFEKETLACGAHLKNTFALAKEDELFVSHHIGDLENLETLQAFEKGVEHFKKLFDIKPELIASDLHPGYLSTKYAEDYSRNFNSYLIKIQHHHAHIISCLVDNGVSNRKVIGVAFDGTGLGTDGNIWGGEFLIADYTDFRRAAHLKYIPLPGAEQAIKEPWRMAATYLYQAFGPKFLSLSLDFTSRLDKKRWKILERMLERKLNSPLASSMGRLFDAVSSLTGLRDRINYAGQAAVELEMAIEPGRGRIPAKGGSALHALGRSPQATGMISATHSYHYEVEKRGGIYIIDPLPLIKGVVEDLQEARPTSFISEKFHNSIARIIVETCLKIRSDFKLKEVALSGGVFQNMFLLNRTFNRLIEEGFKVYIHQRFPSNDGGISLGQAVIANSKLKASK